MIILAKHNVKKVRIYDPITGKYRIVNETPEIKKQIAERQKKRKAEEKQKRLENKIKANQKKLAALQKLNPGQYEEYKVSKKGEIFKDTEDYYEKQQKKLEKEFENAKTIKDTEKRQRKQNKLNKSYSYNEISKAKQRGYKAINDLTDVSRNFNAILLSCPDNLQQAIINAIGGKKLNEDYSYDDFYSERYYEEMLPNMIKEINVLIDKIKLAINVCTDFISSRKRYIENIKSNITDLKSDLKRLSNEEQEIYKREININQKNIEDIQDEIKKAEKAKKDFEQLQDAASNTSTAVEYRVNFSYTENEPYYKNDLHLSKL